jgi:hypothetical protein
MKKIIITLSIIITAFLSFGFIILKNPVNKVQLEEVSDLQVTESATELTVVNESNDEQWD